MKIESIKFRAPPLNGSPPLSVNPGSITILIGPNNGGKSRAIKDILGDIVPSKDTGSVVVDNTTISQITIKELEEKLSYIVDETIPAGKHGPGTISLRHRDFHAPSVNVDIIRSGISSQDPQLKQYILNHITSPFVLILNGETRLSITNPTASQILTEKPHTTAAELFTNDDLRWSISSKIHDAFGWHLAIDPTSMSQFRYALSPTKPDSPSLERSLSQDSIEFYKRCLPITAASDGTRAYIGILSEVMAGNHDIIFIDEPEAFLHPGLAFSLGKALGENIKKEKQLIAATHSANFLLGCISSGLDINIIRLTYSTSESTARALPPKSLSEIIKSPLLKSVGAMSALFYSSAIIVEADSDRAFYDEINQRLDRNGEGIKHPIFLNARNKQTIPDIVNPLRQIGIPAAAIMDIDWIKEDGSVCEKYLSGLGVPSPLRESFRVARKSVRQALENKDQNYKRNGGILVLNGDDRTAADVFFDQMESFGMFTVRTGELESFLPNLTKNKNKSTWLLETFEAMGSSPDDENYITPEDGDVWDFIRRIQQWISNPVRQGMG